MSATTQVTIPENYYIKVSDQLLVAPRPQYLFAKWFLEAMKLSLTIPSGFGLALPDRQVTGQGANYTKFGADDLKLAAALPSDLFAVKIDFNGGPGSVIKVNRPKYVTSTYTAASRRIARGQTISSSPLSISSEQNNLILERYSGPYGTRADGTTGPSPFGLERFDASMGVHNLVQAISLHMQDDFHRFVDYQWPQFGELTGVTKIYADGMTADDDATAVDTFPFSLLELSRAQESMDLANLPQLPDGHRPIVITPVQWRQLQHDPEYQRLNRYYPEYNLIFGRSYVGSVANWHIFVSNTLNNPANSSGVAVQHALAIAPGAFMAGMGQPPRVAPHTDDNYGETSKVVWISYLAFGLSDVTFLRSVRSA